MAVVLVVVGFCIYESIRARDGLPRLAPSPPNDTSSAVSAKPTASSSQLSTCPKRREWRTLSASEQRSYISAVQCLLTIPSTLNLPTANTSAYSDFPYIHAHIGYRTHNSAPFLPWHRYLLHIYETTLRTQCNYSGTLVYWDWTLDSSSLSASPVFDPVTGFGGDGDPDGPITVGKTGRCVVDGPFAGIQALWYDVKYQRHCLSRGFRDDWGNLGFIDGTDVSPESIELAMELDRYEDFVRMMEVKVHDAIPFGIGGDFETFSAPFGKYSFRTSCPSEDCHQQPHVERVTRSTHQHIFHLLISTGQILYSISTTSSSTASGGPGSSATRKTDCTPTMATMDGIQSTAQS